METKGQRRVRLLGSLALTAFLIVLLIAASAIATRRKGSNLSRSCSNIFLDDGHFLEASCETKDGMEKSRLDLDALIGLDEESGTLAFNSRTLVFFRDCDLVLSLDPEEGFHGFCPICDLDRPTGDSV